MLALLREIGLTGLVDIGFMGLLVYAVLVWFKQTRAGFVLTGIIIIGMVYLLARQFNLLLTASVFQAFFAVILVALIVIFQEELRQLFEHIAVWSLNRNLRRRSKSVPHWDEELLVRTLTDFAEDHIGALIVIPGKDPIERHITGGVSLSGELSEPLLKSLFDPHSIGHDGAVILEDGKVSKFSAYLPLSKNFAKLRYAGTRHAAALGMSELTDALCLVVSEEHGRISVARRGNITEISEPARLRAVLTAFYQEIEPPMRSRSFKGFITKNSSEKVIALIVSLALWFVLVHESRIVQETFQVPVAYTPPAPPLVVTDISPGFVEVTVSGPRRAFYLFRSDRDNVLVKLLNAQAGVRRIPISPADLSLPKEMTVDAIQPRHVTVRIEAVNPQ